VYQKRSDSACTLLTPVSAGRSEVLIELNSEPRFPSTHSVRKLA